MRVPFPRLERSRRFFINTSRFSSLVAMAMITGAMVAVNRRGLDRFVPANHPPLFGRPIKSLHATGFQVPGHAANLAS